jgi:threonine dehydratase
MSRTPALPSADDVAAAKRRLGHDVRRTPLVGSAWLSSLAGGEVWLKLESLQVTHSFKARGALNAVRALAERDSRARPRIVTASAGNHGRALAWAAERQGLPCTVFTPSTAPETKRAAIGRHGADLRDDAVDYDAAEQTARDFAADEGATYISPYSHPDVIAGAGTVGLEIAEELPGVDIVVVPLGGGGLGAGVGLAIEAAAPNAMVIGVEVEASTPFTVSLERGHITRIAWRESLADGLVGNLEPDSITFPIVQRTIDRVVTVTEDEVARAIRGLAADEHLIAEGAGAVATAAVLAGRIPVEGRTVAVLVTGANVDLHRLVAVLQA